MVSLRVGRLVYVLAPIYCVLVQCTSDADCSTDFRRRNDDDNDDGPSSTFRDHHRFTPFVVWERGARRPKREAIRVGATSSSSSTGDYSEELTLSIDVFDKTYLVDLQINRDLLPSSHFEKHHSGGKYVVRLPFTTKNASHCYYKGHLRDVPNSWAALSTCRGVSGAIFDGRQLHYIEPLGGGRTDHFVYRHSDLKEQNLTCGYHGSVGGKIISGFDSVLPKRFRRNSEIYGPYNSNRKSRYVELILVNDNKLYKEMKGDLDAVFARSKEIANIANALYTPLNIFIALVGVVVWSDFDEITLSTDGDTTLTNFLYYRRERLAQSHPNDNAQLITGISFNGGVVGKALKGPICTYEYSGGVNMDHNPLVGLVATTVAHELGHNFGMEHDDDDCDCPEDKCIMAPASSQTSPTHWSSCSLEYLKLAFDHGMDYCLRNKPDHIVGPVCGNGFVEHGEECDCGLKKFCNNPCCNATSCMLFPNATCATGSCCNLKTCQVKSIARVCRSAVSDCDLPEFCNGESEFCPVDVFAQDGISCKGGKAYCFHGQCRTHTDQCKLLWGASGQMSDRQCFDNNRKGNALGNCGYFRTNQTYRTCSMDDVLCGMLHCTHLNERLEFGMESVAILSRSFITEGDRVFPCRSAMVDLGLNSIDPGLAPDGARCGDNKVCVNQKCLHVASLRVATCATDCSGNGVCNSNGNCHCNSGYSPPLCDYPGAGGSLDSGPATDPNATNSLAYVMYIIFFAVLPMFALFAFIVYYHRGHLKTWWIAKAREKAINKRVREANQRRSRPASTVITDKGSVCNLDNAKPVMSVMPLRNESRAASDAGAAVAAAAVAGVCPTKPLPSIPQKCNSVNNSGSIGGGGGGGEGGCSSNGNNSNFPSCNAPATTLTRTRSVKAAKLNLDRHSLRNLEISNPIPQVHVAQPPSSSSSSKPAVPVRPAPPRPMSPSAVQTVMSSGRGKRSASDAADRPPSWTSGRGRAIARGRGAPLVTRTSSMRDSNEPVGAGTGVSGAAGSQRSRRLNGGGSFRPTNPPPPRPPPRDRSGGTGAESSTTATQPHKDQHSSPIYEDVIYSELAYDDCHPTESKFKS